MWNGWHGVLGDLGEGECRDVCDMGLTVA